jgi:hypothetical protein
MAFCLMLAGGFLLCLEVSPLPDITTRTAGQLGALAPVFPAGVGFLSDYSAGPLPKPAATIPVPAVADWGMDGNDQLGDCGAAGVDHLFKAAAAVIGLAETFPAGDQVSRYYLQYNHGQDVGVVLSAFLTYVRRHGFCGHKVRNFARIDPHNLPMLKTAVYLYNAAYTGIQVTRSMQQAFEDHEPWTVDELREPVIGGHCVPVVAYDGACVYVVTWGGIQAIEYAAWLEMSTEAWAVMLGEHARGDGHGINELALAADLDRLDVPAPAGAAFASEMRGHLLDEAAAMIRSCAASAEKDVTELVAWLASRGL